MKQKGFTLIELLVVISIIGLLASVLLVALNTSRAKARDAKRAGDIALIKKALELYFDTNGQYPTPGSNGGGQPLSNLSSFLVPTYIASIPTDPKPPQYYHYGWGPTNQDYSILVLFETQQYCKAETPNTYTTWWSSYSNSFGGVTICNLQ